MDIEFDPNKASSNLKKHGVSFAEAASVLQDAMALVREDDDAEGEARFLVVGISDAGHMLTVCYTLIDDKVIRLISASAVSRKWLDIMKPMDFFARQGADPQPYGVYGKGMQRRMAEKDAVSCRGICETLH